MNSFLKVLFSITLLLSLVLAGIFCSQGMEMMDAHCSGDTSSIWCSDFLSHGTIISNVVLTTIFSILSLVFVVLLTKTFFNFILKVERILSCCLRVRDRIPISSPIQIAFSRGIIHSRIP